MTWETRHFIGLPLQDERWKTFSVQCLQVKYLEEQSQMFSPYNPRNSNCEKPQKMYKPAFWVKRPHALSDGQWGQVRRSWRLYPRVPDRSSFSLCLCPPGMGNSCTFFIFFLFLKQLYWGIMYIAWNSPAVSVHFNGFFFLIHLHSCMTTTTI